MELAGAARCPLLVLTRGARLVADSHAGTEHGDKSAAAARTQ
jgi:hypothetical protein